MAFSSSPPASTSTLPADLSPASFDTLPVLTAILTRLQSVSPSDASTSISSPHQSQPLTHSLSQNQTQPTSSPAQISNLNSQDKEKFAQFSTIPLTTKEIPAATDALKHRLQKARALVKELPDVERGMREQEVEIKELEGKIAEQRAVLEQLRALGARSAAEEGEGNDGLVRTPLEQET